MEAKSEAENTKPHAEDFEPQEVELMENSKPRAEDEDPKPQGQEEAAMESSKLHQAAMGDSKQKSRKSGSNGASQAEKQAAMEHPKPQTKVMGHPRSLGCFIAVLSSALGLGCSSDIAASSSTGEESIQYPKPRLRLESIESSEKHRFMLREWKREAKFLERDFDSKLSSCGRSKKDLATILGLNFAFQGLLVSGVAPSQNVVCRHSPFVCVLSAVASLGAFFATLRKLEEMASNKQRLNFQIKQMVWHDARLNELKEQGNDYDVEDIKPFDLGVGDISGKGALQSWAAQARMLFDTWVWSHLGAILALLLAFSATIVFCIQRLLCN